MNTKVRPNFCVPDYNPRVLEYNTYRNSITEPAPQFEPEAPVEIERCLLHVSSQHRDRNYYPDPGYFKVAIPGGFKDVVAVELVGGTLPNIPSLTANPYILMDMGPLFNQIRSLDGNSYFAIINVFNHISNTGFLTVDRSQTEGKPTLFKPIKESLNELFIRFLLPDGSQVLFGDEPPNTLMDFSKQVSLVFNIHRRVRRPHSIYRDSRTIPYMV